MSNVLSFATRNNDLDAGSNDRSLAGEVSKLTELARNTRQAAGDVERAVSRLEDMDLAARAREIAEAKRASL